MSYDDFEYFNATRDGSVLTLAFNRADDLNGMDGPFHAELAEIFAAVARDRETRAIVLTGEGRAFSVGAKWDWIRNQTPAELEVSMIEARKIIIDLLEVRQPVIAAINGHAIGLGATIAMFCDFAYAANGCKIGDPHVPIGLVAGDGGAVIWPWLTGMMRAKRYLLTGDPVTAEEAEAMGLITEALPREQVLPAAEAMAQRLAAMPRLSLEGTKISLNKILRETTNLMLDTSLALEHRSKESPDHLAALDAWEASLSSKGKA